MAKDELIALYTAERDKALSGIEAIDTRGMRFFETVVGGSERETTQEARAEKANVALTSWNCSLKPLKRGSKQPPL